MNLDQSIGIMAGFLTTFAVIPQIIKTIKTKRAKDISFWQMVILMTGMTLWLYYGIRINDIPLISANSFSLLCYSLLLTAKLFYDRK